MPVTVGAFNLNNLFSRLNFRAEVDTDLGGDGRTLEASYTFSDPAQVRVRSYRGALVAGKDAAGRGHVARRLLGTHEDLVVSPPVVDVCAVQEVEDIDTLRFVAATELGGVYPHVVLIEGIDPRLIDLTVLSRLPLWGVTSWQHARHRSSPGEWVFRAGPVGGGGVEPAAHATPVHVVQQPQTCHFVPFGDNQEAGALAANRRRQEQAEVIAEIVAARDPPDLPVCDHRGQERPSGLALAGTDDDLHVAAARRVDDPGGDPTRENDNPAPASTAWTQRFKQGGQPARHRSFDHGWLSPALGTVTTGAWIGRRAPTPARAAATTPPSCKLSI